MLWADTPRSLALVTAPVDEPISYEEAYAFLRLNTTTDEAFVRSLVTVARSQVEEDTGLLLPTQTWDLTFDRFPEDAIRPPTCPLQSVSSITTINRAGGSSVLAAGNYQVDLASRPARIVLSATGAWPTDIRETAGITIRCVAGYASAAAIPRPLVAAMWQIIAVYYQQRTSVPSVLPPRWLGYDRLIAGYRLPSVG